MAAHAKPAPDTDQHNLDLLRDSNGNWLYSVTIGVAAEFLQVSPQRIRTLAFKRRLASEGFRQTRRILVSSLLAFEPDTYEKRAARARANIAKVPSEERKRRGQKAAKTRMERFTPEQRSAFPKAQLANSTEEQRTARAKARFANSTPEHLSAFRGTSEQRRARAKKASATLGPGKRSERAKKGAPAREAKKTLEQRNRLKEWRANCSQEQQSEIARKAADARKAKYPPEQHSAWGKNAAAAVSPEKQIENGNRLRKYHTDLKAKAARLDAIENGTPIPGPRAEIVVLLKAKVGFTNKQFADYAGVEDDQWRDWKRGRAHKDGSQVDLKIRVGASRYLQEH